MTSWYLIRCLRFNRASHFSRGYFSPLARLFVSTYVVSAEGNRQDDVNHENILNPSGNICSPFSALVFSIVLSLRRARVYSYFSRARRAIRCSDVTSNLIVMSFTVTSVFISITRYSRLTDAYSRDQCFI